MKAPLFLTVIALGLSGGNSSASDLPSDIMENEVLPKMDLENMENLGSTNQDNYKKVQEYKRKNAIFKKTKITCPSGEKAGQAFKTSLQASGSDPLFKTEATEIQGKGWKLASSEAKLLENPHEDQLFEGASLERVYLINTSKTGEMITCSYRKDGRIGFSFSRALNPSLLNIQPPTCKVENPAHQKLIASSKADLDASNIDIHFFPSFPETDALELLCDQKPRQ